MKVSIIMPLYNKASFVKEAIESVLSQGFESMELIVVDDASIDDSLKVVEGVNDDRIKIYRNERNLGAALCAQRAIDKACGEYLLRLDADDICVLNRIEKQVKFMDDHPEIGASGGYLQLFGNRDKLWKFPENDVDCKVQLLFTVPVSQGASILRNSVIKEHNIRYADDWPPVGEDWLYWLQWSKVSRFGNLQEAITLYRRGAQNASFGRNKYEDHKKLFEQVFSFYEIPMSKREVELHLYTMKLFDENPNPESIRAFRTHLYDLKKKCQELDVFAQDKLIERLERSWRELFYYLPPFGKNVVARYKQISGGLNDQQRKYYSRFRINKFLGRA